MTAARGPYGVRSRDGVRIVSEATGTATERLLNAAHGVSQDTGALMQEVESVLQSIRAA